MDGEFSLQHISIEPERETDQPPGVIVIHGRGADEQDLLPLARELPDHLHVLSVRAPDQLGPGYTWYELDLSQGGLHQSQPDPDEYDRSQNLLTTFVEQAVDAYDLDPTGVGLLGFSQGAILSLGALVERPKEYRWVVALHGYLPARYDASELRAAADRPVFLGVGSQDQVIPAVRGEESAERLGEAGVDVTFRTYPVGHGTAREEVADVREWVESQESDVV